MFYIIVMWIRPVFAVFDIGPVGSGSKVHVEDREELDPNRIHQIHRISGRIRIWIRCTPKKRVFNVLKFIS